MNDYISRQAAIEKIHSEFDECLVWDESGKHTADEVERILDTIPPADVRPAVSGKWLHEDSASNYSAFKCSVCGTGGRLHKFPFCSQCGADMRGGDADGDEED